MFPLFAIRRRTIAPLNIPSRVALCDQLRIVLSCLRKPGAPQFKLSLAHMVFLHFGKNVPRISSSVKYPKNRMDQHGHVFGGRRERKKPLRYAIR
jgi:hypothetical protein